MAGLDCSRHRSCVRRRIVSHLAVLERAIPREMLEIIETEKQRRRQGNGQGRDNDDAEGQHNHNLDEGQCRN
jgi:hypothetical protein